MKALWRGQKNLQQRKSQWLEVLAYANPLTSSPVSDREQWEYTFGQNIQKAELEERYVEDDSGKTCEWKKRAK
jgi:hypothetical protein